MIWNTMIALPAQPERARAMLTAAPMPTEMKGLTFDRVVLKLLAAMKEEKQAGGKAAIASRNIIHLAALTPMITGIRPGLCRIIFPPPAVTAALLNSGEPYVPATISIEAPAERMIASAAPTMPPMLTSRLSLLLVPKYAPAAPAVAKNPTTNVIMNASTPKELKAEGALATTVLCKSANFAASKLPIVPT